MRRYTLLIPKGKFIRQRQRQQKTSKHIKRTQKQKKETVTQTGGQMRKPTNYYQSARRGEKYQAQKQTM